MLVPTCMAHCVIPLSWAGHSGSSSLPKTTAEDTRRTTRYPGEHQDTQEDSMIPLTTPRHPGGLPEPKRIHRHQGRHPVELQAEFPRAGLVGTQIPTKYVLVCAKFRLLNAKLKRIFFGTFYLIVAVFFIVFLNNMLTAFLSQQDKEILDCLGLRET